MKRNDLGRRRFLRSAAAGVIGMVGGVAATGTVAAGNQNEIWLESNYGRWSYQIATPPTYSIEKGGWADGADTLLGSRNNIAEGNVNKGGRDNYWTDGGINRIQVSPSGLNSRLVITPRSTGGWNGGAKTMMIRAFGDPGSHRYDYTINMNGAITTDYTDTTEDSDYIYNSGTSAQGYVNLQGKDIYGVQGVLDHVYIDHPYDDDGFHLEFYS